MPHEGRLSVCVTCRIHTDAAMLRGAISLSIFWKPIDGQRRGLTHFGLKPARRDGSAVLDSVDTYKCPPEAPERSRHVDPFCPWPQRYGRHFPGSS